jgi:formylglycine-generating enzyme required for sulfatase activity
MTRRQLAGNLALGVAAALVGAGLAGCRGPGASRGPVEEPRARVQATAAAVSRYGFRASDGWGVSPENERKPGEAGWRILHPGSSVEMVYVPGGTFTMGSPVDDPSHDPDWASQAMRWGTTMHAATDEKPQHRHLVNAFWIGRTEVTVGQWRQVMGTLAPRDPSGQVPNDRDDHPVVWVTQEDAKAFCKALGLRLPSEAEWEYAAAGPVFREFPWGNDWNDKWCSNYSNRGPEGTAFPVGRVPHDLSWCGALDMAGNVSEWCADWYDGKAYQRYATGDLSPPREQRPARTELIPGPPSRKVVIPPDGRVVRGGSWADDIPPTFRCAHRSEELPGLAFGTLGFRCARSAE